MKNADNGHSQQKRHKCSICKSVRFENKMTRILHSYSGTPKKTRYGHECWVCKDSLSCQKQVPDFYTY